MTSRKFHQDVSHRERFHVEAIAELPEERQQRAPLPIVYDDPGHREKKLRDNAIGNWQECAVTGCELLTFLAYIFFSGAARAQVGVNDPIRSEAWRIL